MSKKTYKLFLIALCMCFLVASIAGCSEILDSEDYDSGGTTFGSTGAKVGQKLPEATFEVLESDQQVVLPVKGKYTIINLWATWCPPCQEEMPEIQKFYEKYKSDDSIAFYSINLDESNQEIKSFFRKYKLSFPVLIDHDEKSLEMLSTDGIPTTVIVSPDGIVKFRRVGSITLDELEGALFRAQNSK